MTVAELIEYLKLLPQDLVAYHEGSHGLCYVSELERCTGTMAGVRMKGRVNWQNPEPETQLTGRWRSKPAPEPKATDPEKVKRALLSLLAE